MGTHDAKGNPTHWGNFHLYLQFTMRQTLAKLSLILSLSPSLSPRVCCAACTCVCVRASVRREGSSWLRLRLRCDTSTYSTPTDATASAVVGSVSSAAALASLGIPLAMRVGSPTRWHVHLHSCWPAERSLQQVGCLSESYSNNVAGAEAR